LVAATFIAGIILILLGFFKIGSMIKFIPYPITVGFTAGIAVTIFVGQIKDFMGLKIENVPAEFVNKIIVYAENIHTLNFTALAIGILAVVIIVLWSKVTKLIPGSLVAIIITTLISVIFKLDIETIGSKFDDLATSFPAPVIPQFSLKNLDDIIPSAISIAFLGGMESLLSAVVADGMTGQKHNSNMELIGQGIGNIVSSLFGGLPVTGAIARTAANIKNGGKTPIASIVHSAIILLCTLIFMPLAKLIPMTTLAAVLFIVCYNMVEKESIKELLKTPKSDIAVMISVFLLTIIFDLVVAIQIGILLAALLFIKRTVDHFGIFEIPGNTVSDNMEVPEALKEKIMIYRIHGPFFFGAAFKFIEVAEQMNNSLKVVILCMEHVNFIDATALHALRLFISECKKKKIKTYIVGAKGQSLMAMGRSGVLRSIGADYLFDTIPQAIEKGQLKEAM
jgi:SulP family sulfate permease